MIDAPFPYFGGKKTIAATVWSYLGDVDTYVEPFFGSGAVLLQRPHAAKIETVNDMDGMIANFWRAVRAAPGEVAHHADWPCNEVDLHARHLWLVAQRGSLTGRLMADPDHYDAKAAGWWVWGACNWIGSGWCSGNGPWQAVDGVLTDMRQLPHMGDAGRGINRQLPHMSAGQGISRKLPHMGDAGRGEIIRKWFSVLSERLRGVRVACGDWKRVCGPSVRRAGGAICGVFLDPPYDLDERASVYSYETPVARDALAWAKENGAEKGLRIVLAGYNGEHNSLEAMGWRSVAWSAGGGYGNQGSGRGADNRHRERLWISPHCLRPDEADLFSILASEEAGTA